MASTILAKVDGREITVEGYEPPSAGDVGTCAVRFEIAGLLAELPRKRVTFSTKGACVTVDYADEIPVPQECLAVRGSLRLTVTGYDAGGAEVARTHRMEYPISVKPAGEDEGASPSRPTLDVVSRIDALASRLEASEDARDEAFAAAQGERETAFESSQAANQAAFDAAQAGNASKFEEAEKARESAFAGHVGAWGAKVDAEAAKAAKAASDATDAAGKANEASAAASASAEAADAAADAANQAAASLAPDLAKTSAELAREKKRLENVVAVLNGVAYAEETDSSEAHEKDVPKGAQRWACLGMVGGRTVAWNQLAQPQQRKSTEMNGVTFEVDGYKVTANGTATDAAYLSVGAIPITAGHKYVILSCPDGGGAGTYNSYATGSVDGSRDYGQGCIVTASKSGVTYYVPAYVSKGVAAENLVFRIRIHDLTLMFGAGNEPSTAEEFRAMFPEAGYPYNPGELSSAPVKAVKARGRNLLDASLFAKKFPASVFFSSGVVDVANTEEAELFSEGLDVDIPAGSIVSYRVVPKENMAINGRLRFVYEDGLYTETYLTTSSGDVRQDYVVSDRMKKRIVGIKLNWSIFNSGFSFKDFQVERGPSPTPYVPYREWAAYEVPQEAIGRCPLYGASAGNAYNRIDCKRKAYVQRVGSVDLGTLEWSYNETYRFFMTSHVPNRACANSNMLCARGSFMPKGWWSKESPDVDGYFGNESSGVFYFVTKDGTTDPAAFKAAMAGVTLHYELANPVEVDLSDVLPDNLIEVESGGTLTFEGGDNRLPVPSEVTYQVSTREAANG